jgi:hypothetical protein
MARVFQRKQAYFVIIAYSESGVAYTGQAAFAECSEQCRPAELPEIIAGFGPGCLHFPFQSGKLKGFRR